MTTFKHYYLLFGAFCFAFFGATVVFAVDATIIEDDTITLDIIRKELKQGYDTLSSDPKSALNITQEVLELLDMVEDDFLIAETYYLQGKANKNMGNFTSAIVNFEESAELYKKIDSLDKYASAMNSLGVIFDHLGDYDEALEHYLISLNNLDESNKKGLVYAHNNVGAIYIARKSYDRAKLYLDSAIALARRYSLNESLTFPYHNLGDIYAEQASYDSALYFYKQSYLIDTLTHDKAGIGINLKAMAEVYAQLNMVDEARSHIEDALVYLLQSGDKFHLSSTYICLGEISLSEGNFEKAIINTQKGFDIALELQAKNELQNAARVLSDIYKEMGDSERALQYSDLYHTYKDSIFNEAKSIEIALLQLKQAEVEKNLLKVDNELQAAQMNDQQLLIERQTYIVIIISFGLILSIIILVVLNNANRDKNEANIQLVHQKKEIEKIIAELKSLNYDIERQKNELEDSNKIKDKLISIISHDFRSPLNSLEGVLVLLSEGQISESEMKVIAHELRLKVNVTTTLLDNLLNWAKNQMQGIESIPESFDIKSLIQETYHLVGLQAENKGVEIINDTSSEISENVFADYEMIKLVLRNLLSNAIKFTNKGGQVFIHARQEEAFLRLSVQDSGVGMTPDQLSNIFTNQNSSTLGTSYEKGTGLGLMLCKDFVEKNGGEIFVQSQEGIGSTFSFTILLTHQLQKPLSKKYDCTEK